MQYQELIDLFGEKTAKREIKALIKKNTTTLVFTKANGDKRALIGTTSLDKLPASVLSEESSDRPINEDIQIIYDLESQGWRSFRWDRLLEIYNHEV